MLKAIDDPADVPLGPNGRAIKLGGFGVELNIGGQLLPVLRLVVNAIPLNCCLVELLLDCLQLAGPSQLSSFRLLSREGWLLTIADRSPFFYIFRLKGLWVAMQQTHWKDPTTGAALGLQTLSMGLSLAVGVTEHIHRNLVSAQESAGLTPFPLRRETEVRRDMPLPLGEPEVFQGGLHRRENWILYIDDLRHQETVDLCHIARLRGTDSEELKALLSRYEATGLPGTVEARLETVAKSLGEEINGELGPRDLPAAYHFDIPDLVTWGASQPGLELVERQITQSRLNRLALPCFCLARWRVEN